MRITYNLCWNINKGILKKRKKKVDNLITSGNSSKQSWQVCYFASKNYRVLKSSVFEIAFKPGRHNVEIRTRRGKTRSDLDNITKLWEKGKIRGGRKKEQGMAEETKSCEIFIRYVYLLNRKQFSFEDNTLGGYDFESIVWSALKMVWFFFFVSIHSIFFLHFRIYFLYILKKLFYWLFFFKSRIISISIKPKNNKQ